MDRTTELLINLGQAASEVNERTKGLVLTDERHDKELRELRMKIESLQRLVWVGLGAVLLLQTKFWTWSMFAQ